MSENQSNQPALGLLELIAIALGGMVGGGIFTVLGISVDLIGVWTPVAIFLGGLIAALAAYSYIKLGVYYKAEGATYSFYKLVYPSSPFAASLIGWWVMFGYISTLALYAYTFSSYAISSFEFANNEWVRKLVAGGIIAIFTAINLWSVKGMGKIEDLMVYSKLVILLLISIVLMTHNQTTLPTLMQAQDSTPLLAVIIVASLTFVAYEGFQLVINAVNEMASPEKNIPRAIYSAITLAIIIYIVIALGAILAIPLEDIANNKEYALAAGAADVLGHWGADLVIVGALLATSSAISGTLFGASRQMAVISEDGYMPKLLSKRHQKIPSYSIVFMAVFAFVLILSGNLQVILEFGSVTFLLVSLLMGIANFKVRKLTKSSAIITLFSIASLAIGTLLIVYYELKNQPEQLVFIVGLYFILTSSAWLYSRKKTT